MAYLVKEKNSQLLYSETKLVENLSILKIIDHPIRLKILKMLAKEPMYPAKIAKELKLHEQKIYYHVKQMSNSGILDVVERQEIRGTTAKKLAPRFLNFSFSLSEEWKSLADLIENKDKEIMEFLSPFVLQGKFNSNIIVGSPDPHGPHKARTRDGHYAIDLALFLGNHCQIEKDFSTMLDVDVKLKESNNLILVGGPVTNLVVAKINEFLPAKFSDEKPWGIITKKNTYTEESIGLVCRIQNPFNKEGNIMVIAGIRFVGTKAAVLALTRFTKNTIYRFSGQREFYAIVQGFDMDADGKIDEIEVLE